MHGLVTHPPVYAGAPPALPLCFLTYLLAGCNLLLPYLLCSCMLHSYILTNMWVLFLPSPAPLASRLFCLQSLAGSHAAHSLPRPARNE